MKIIDGKRLQKIIIEKNIKSIKKKMLLTIILVGENSSSKIYVKNKIKMCEKYGIKVKLIYFLKSSEDEIIKIIENENENEETNGILVQLPLPKNIDEIKILSKINILKDVDGLNPLNQGLNLVGNEKSVLPCTPKGIIKIIDYCDFDVKGKKIVIVGKSNIVGKPLASILINKGATITICDINTKKIDLEFFTRNADMIISATGVKHLIKKDMVKKNSFIIDVGIIYENNKIFGDVDFENIKSKAMFITPVPGGVGPITIAMVIENLVLLTKRQINQQY